MTLILSPLNGEVDAREESSQLQLHPQGNLHVAAGNINTVNGTILLLQNES